MNAEEFMESSHVTGQSIEEGMSEDTIYRLMEAYKDQVLKELIEEIECYPAFYGRKSIQKTCYSNTLEIIKKRISK